MEKQNLHKNRFLIAGLLLCLVLLAQMFGWQYLPYALLRIPYLMPCLFACFYFIVGWIAAFYGVLSSKKLLLRSIGALGIFILVYVFFNFCIESATKTFYDSAIFENKLFFTLGETLSDLLTACIPPILAGIPFVRLRPVAKRAKRCAVGAVAAYIILCFLLNLLVSHDLFSDFDSDSVLSYFSLLTPPTSYQIWQKLHQLLSAVFPFVYALILASGQKKAAQQTEA